MGCSAGESHKSDADCVAKCQFEDGWRASRTRTYEYDKSEQASRTVTQRTAQIAVWLASLENTHFGIHGTEVCFCEKGVGNGPVDLDTRSVSSQITTTRPATGRSSSRRLTQQAPPARIERHYFHSVDSGSPIVESEQDIHAVFDSSESEDESGYPLGYYDESGGDWEQTGGQLAYPTFSPSQLEQQPALDTGFQGDYYGGVLEVSETEFSPQQNISTGSASLFLEDAEPVDEGSDFSQDHEQNDYNEYDSGGARSDSHDDHYDYESGGAGYDSDGGYSSGCS
ncbi:hypothetical protein CYMTET_54055 [Cymbomonas tetramitiformis]|uniref:Uncharacterized protein n=1 Tax=Cymbomonas tetramitiformis TaxID=36881 RepID=A0AAE0EPG8_9CHLO|nr:hypothetical protein CYMTET_54055 [Cymbomonas tetramitiformis]